MISDDYCVQKAAPPGADLYYCTLYLAPQQRQALIALYAFQHEIGDIVLNCTDIEPARAKLAWWRMQTAALYQQHPDHPVTKALAEALQHFFVPQEHLQEIIDGFDMDLNRSRYDDFKTLEHCCHRVSSMVSLIASNILGGKDTQTAKFAHEIGLASRLADIVCDVGLDARQGRIYLPLDELQQFGVSEDDILNARQSDKTEALLEFQVKRINQLYAHALSLLPPTEKKSQRVLLAMAALQRGVLDEIVRDNYRVLDRSLSLTPLRKLWIVTRIWLGT